MQARFETPRKIRTASGKPSPWHILGEHDTTHGAGSGLYDVKRENTGKRAASDTIGVQVYQDAPDGVPAYVVAEVDRQHNADQLREVYDRRAVSRVIVERDGFMIRVFIVTPNGLANVTGFLAHAYGFRLSARSGGRRWIRLAGGGYSPTDHVINGMAFVLGVARDAIRHDAI